jgi:hypothetical protein
MAVMPVSSEENGTLTIDDLLHMEYAGMSFLSPDGTHLVYRKSEGTGLLPEFINGSVIF